MQGLRVEAHSTPLSSVLTPEAGRRAPVTALCVAYYITVEKLLHRAMDYKRKENWLESLALVCCHCLSVCHLPADGRYHCRQTHHPGRVPGARWHHYLPALVSVRRCPDQGLRLWGSQADHLAGVRL